MNRTGLLIALSIAAVTGLLFGIYPDIDLQVARYFYSFSDGSNNFSWRIYPPLMIARNIGLWISTLLIMSALAALAWKLIFPRRKLLMSARAILFLIATLALGPGVFVNVILKDHWGRSRPIDVRQFGGPEHFVPWWDPRGDCPSNCSFVSGDASGAFWTTAPAMLAPSPFRAVAIGGALVLGASVAVMRVMAGGHFVSDVIFAGVFTFMVVWLVHGLIFRWTRTRLSDEAVERMIERIAILVQKALAHLFGEKPKKPK